MLGLMTRTVPLGQLRGLIHPQAQADEGDMFSSARFCKVKYVPFQYGYFSSNGGAVALPE